MGAELHVQSHAKSGTVCVTGWFFPLLQLDPGTHMHTGGRNHTYSAAVRCCELPCTAAGGLGPEVATAAFSMRHCALLLADDSYCGVTLGCVFVPRALLPCSPASQACVPLDDLLVCNTPDDQLLPDRYGCCSAAAEHRSVTHTAEQCFYSWCAVASAAAAQLLERTLAHLLHAW